MQGAATAVRRWLAVVALLLSCSSAAAARDVFVRILSMHPPAQIRLQTGSTGRVLIGEHAEPWEVGETLLVETVPQGVRVTHGRRSPAVAPALTVASPDIHVQPRRFTGAITFRAPDGRALYAVNRVPLEDYVAGVVASEALAGTPPEALRAQAVAVRSYAAALAGLDRPRDGARGPHTTEGYDFCDLTHCQSFRGTAVGAAVEAARATQGLVLYSGSRVVAASYHSTCGGRTADPADVGADIALHGVSDVPVGGRAWCAASPHYRWQVDIPARYLLTALNSDRDTAPGKVLQDVRVLSRLSDGRVRQVEIVGEHLLHISGQDFWQTLGRSLGWGRIESAWFSVRRAASSFHFEGRGLGHGAGLCQYGSAAMARAGWNMRSILAHYYPGTRLDPMIQAAVPPMR